jgi:hypothetical protein
MVGIYFEKTGTSTNGTSCILHNNREPRAMTMHLDVFYINNSEIYLKIPEVVELPEFSPSGKSVYFILYRKDKIRTIRKNLDGW